METNREHSIAFYSMDLNNINTIARNYEWLYIYGAGMVGRVLYNYLEKYELQNKLISFIVSEYSDKSSINGIDIVELNSLSIVDNSVVFLAAVSNHRKQMVKRCIDKGIHNYIEINAFDDRNYMYYRSLNRKEYEIELKLWYKRATGDELDLDSPKSFNEKINWLKLYGENKDKTILTDKFLVREYVSSAVGKQYLIPLYGVWNSFDAIEFNRLPNEFVLKCNHGSGWNRIIRDKEKTAIDDLKGVFDKWMKMDFAFVNGFELHYHGITPRIIAEKYLSDDNNNPVNDYKVYVFKGEAKFIQVDIDRFGEHKRNIYSTSWKLLSYEIRLCCDIGIHVEKPKRLDELIEVAEALAEPFDFVRVDLYIFNDLIYFGEMTFTPGSGALEYRPKELNSLMGSWMK